LNDSETYRVINKIILCSNVFFTKLLVISFFNPILLKSLNLLIFVFFVGGQLPVGVDEQVLDQAGLPRSGRRMGILF